MADRIELPPLPEAKYAPSLYPVRLPDYCYTADQMRAYAEQHAADLRGRMGVLVGLLREAREVVMMDDSEHLYRGQCPDSLHQHDRDAECPACALLDRIDAALSPAGEDLLTGESK